MRGTNIPNIKSKLWATRIQDELTNNQAISLPGSLGGNRDHCENQTPIPPLQSNLLANYSIVGTDVEALFPSLQDIEVARMAREAVMLSKTDYLNVNIELALRYLIVTGGRSHVEEIGLKRISPRWLGTRQDLLTVGGESIGDDKKWSKMCRVVTEEERKKVISRGIETAVLVCMNTHIYSFGSDLYLQQSGGPIGMRFTAALANIIMKYWDLKWLELIRKKGC